MSISRLRMYAGNKLGIPLEGQELARLHVWRERNHGGLEKPLRLFRRSARIGLAEPVIALPLVDPNDCVWKRPLSARHQTADMIGMQMSEIDLVDLLRLITRGAEIAQQIARAWPQQRAGTRIDQDQPGPRIHEK